MANTNGLGQERRDMGFGMAVPWAIALSLIVYLVDVVVGDGLDDILYDDAYLPYDSYNLDSAYDDLTKVTDDLLEDFGYGTDSIEEYAGYGENSLFYYSDEFDEYYNTYGIHADEYGYDYFNQNSPEEAGGDCKEDGKGKASTKEEVCDLKVEGVNQHLTKDLPGGIDGVYKVDGCFEGLPKYKRTGKTVNDTRVMWKSAVFNDWDISVGEEVNLAHAVVYGIGNGLEARPNFLEKQNWRLIANIAKDKPAEGGEFVPVNVTVVCQGKKQLTEDKQKRVVQPLLTDEETDANYRAVYNRYQRSADPSINVFMILFMLALGAGVVVAIPRLLKRKQRDGRTLAQVIEDARKQRQGHTS